MLKAIAQAKKRIEFLTFIYWTGNIAREFTNALANKAEEGVGFLKECRLPGVNLLESGSDEITNEKGVVAENPDNLDFFTKGFIRAIAQHRHWDREDIDKMPE